MVFDIDDDTAIINDIAVNSNFRGKGIGSKLVRFIFEQFEVNKIIAETDDDAVMFYKRCGFEECVDVDYVQPAYAPHLPSLPLRLMITDKNNVDVNKVVQLIHRIVYNFE